ncbi:MAG: hypothetical protein AAGJ18_07030 [Bacteroidota bacterium]
MKYQLPKINMDRAAIRAFFKTDRGIFLISMGIALLFWVLVKLSKEYTAKRTVRVSYNIPAEMSFVTIPPEQILVSLKGRGWDLMYDYFGDRQRAVKFSLTDVPLQTISNSQLRTKVIENTKSSNISVEDLNPFQIPVELSEKATRKVPIILEQTISFAPEHQLQKPISMVPDSVTISGPIALLEAYASWPTTALRVENLSSTIQQTVALAAVEQPQISLSEQTVAVEISVEQFTEKSLFLPVVVKNGPDSLKVFPPSVKTSFVVGLSQYDTINEADFTLEVDLKNVNVNQTNNTAPIWLTKSPKSVKNIQFSPKAVSFLFVEQKEEE